MRLPAALSVALIAVASLRAEAPSMQGTMPEDLMPDLKSLLQTAVERSPNAIIASIAVEQAIAAKDSAFSSLYPSVSVNGDYAVSAAAETNSPTSHSKGFFYSAGVSQAIFQWGAYKNQALIGSLGLKIADRQYAEAYRQLAYLIREQYMALIYKKMSLRNEDFKVKIAQEDLNAEKVRLSAGSASQAEMQSFELALEDASLRRDRIADDYGYYKQQFIRMVGVDSLPDSAIPAEIPHPQYSADMANSVYTGFVGTGVESTFQSQVYELGLKQDDLEYSIAKVRQLPKVAGSAGYSYSNNTQAGAGTVAQYGVKSTSYSVSASWDIFDGFATQASKMSVLASKRSAERTFKSYVDATVDSIDEMRHQLGFSARALALAEIHFALIDAQVKRLSEDKALGYASQATIDTGILNQYASQFDMTYARSDYLGHWTEYISLAGLDPAIDNISSRYVR
jgi:outer membrane protein, multidrug efflux system